MEQWYTTLTAILDTLTEHVEVMPRDGLDLSPWYQALIRRQTALTAHIAAVPQSALEESRAVTRAVS
jgi:hypothetical protein